MCACAEDRTSFGIPYAERKSSSFHGMLYIFMREERMDLFNFRFRNPTFRGSLPSSRDLRIRGKSVHANNSGLIWEKMFIKEDMVTN